MELIKTATGKLSSVLDLIAGGALVTVMLLVVSNVLLRWVFNRSILGAFELAGYLTALVIGLALAYCAVQNGHIAISFVVERFPARVQHITDLLINGVVLVFLLCTTWHMALYAIGIYRSGEVSATAEIPFFLFIGAVAAGLLALSLVIMTRFLELMKKVMPK